MQFHCYLSWVWDRKLEVWTVPLTREIWSDHILLVWEQVETPNWKVTSADELKGDFCRIYCFCSMVKLKTTQCGICLCWPWFWAPETGAWGTTLGFPAPGRDRQVRVNSIGWISQPELSQKSQALVVSTWEGACASWYAKISLHSLMTLLGKFSCESIYYTHEPQITGTSLGINVSLGVR